MIYIFYGIDDILRFKFDWMISFFKVFSLEFVGWFFYCSLLYEGID